VDPARTQVTHATNSRNQIESLALDGSSGGAGASTVHPKYDAAGNLVFDGRYFYQYDAWNRLLQVNRAHEEFPVTTPGVPNPVIIEEMVKHLAYDGLGRLIRVQSPFPSVEAAAGRVRSEWFFYDGIRRVQEVVTDPLVNLDFTATDGSPELQDAANDNGPDYDTEIRGGAPPAGRAAR
jgi:hypothetical protein